MSDIKAKIDKKAQDAGFDYAEYVGKKGIYNVYVCAFKGDDVRCTGFPQFVLENEGKMRIANGYKETSLMDLLED